MKLKKIKLLFIVLMAGNGLNAQNLPSTPPKWEIGIDALYLVSKNRLPDYTLFVRLHHKPLCAWRLRIGTDYRTNSLPLSTKKIEKASLLVRLGHEWGKEIAKNTNLFWGLDANYQKNEIEAWLLPAPQAPPFYFPDFDWQLGVVGFIGCKYSISPNFSVSIESSLKYCYREVASNNYLFGTITTSPSTILLGGSLTFDYQSTRTSTVLELQPVQVLNLSYHF